MVQKKCSTNYDRFGYHVNNKPMLARNNQITSFSPIMKCISFFTSDNYIRQLYYYIRGAKLDTINSNSWKLTFLGEQVEFSRLSDLLLSNPYFSQQELLNFQERMRKCHLCSMGLMFYYSCNLVTGYIDSIIERGKIIHSWVETDDGNVLDYCSNLVIKKEDYYRLVNPEVINTISTEEYLNDINLFGEIDMPFSDKFYCLFRNEILVNLEATHLFDKNESFQKMLHH